MPVNLALSDFVATKNSLESTSAHPWEKQAIWNDPEIQAFFKMPKRVDFSHIQIEKVVTIFFNICGALSVP